MTTPAEERAARDGLAVVTLLTFEAINIAQGHPMICRTMDGTQVLVRLFTADEFLTRQHEAAAEWGAPLINHGRALELVQPLPEVSNR